MSRLGVASRSKAPRSMRDRMIENILRGSCERESHFAKLQTTDGQLTVSTEQKRSTTYSR